ncbi:hypothetical protein TNCV_4296491 [Trichonephila clavipes]|nr:hypothetical protein TNCV_4296491 [Trichonephila clavipes]
MRQGAGPVRRSITQPLPTVSPNSSPTIVMVKPEAGFVSKHNVLLFCCTYPPFIALLAAQTPGFQSRVDEAMAALQTFFYAASDIEWNEREPNDAQQTKSVALGFVMWLREPSLPCAQSACHHGQQCNEMGVIGSVIFSCIQL